jgi:hypothetical protein
VIIFFYDIWGSIKRIFAPRMLAWHILAITLTFIILSTGLDWKWFSYFNGTWMQNTLFVAVALGGIIPIVTPFALLAVAKLRKSEQLRIAAGATAQAAALGWLVSALYKAFTGRIPPPLRSIGALVDSSHGFQFGFWRGGIFWGWPSSHTTVAFAVSVALVTLFGRKHKLFAAFVILYAFLIGFGVSTSIHWLSEFVAGAIFGSIVGVAVGKGFAHLQTGQKSTDA